MARSEANLTIFMLASDYDPAHYYNWTENELSALGDCRAVAEVIKKGLEGNGTKVKEMYVIVHKGEKKATKKFHSVIDETKNHYHIVVKFEPNHGATLKEIAKFISVPPEIIEKPKSGGHSYDNMLSYLTHIKYENKIQYAPEDVVTLAGTEYMDYFNENKERWIKARDIVTKKGGKPLDRRFREAIKKLESGELSYDELSGVPEYRQLFLIAKYQRQLEATQKMVQKLAFSDWLRLYNELRNNEISKEEAATREEYKLAFEYYSDLIC